jgi:hypothetical protein
MWRIVACVATAMMFFSATPAGAAQLPSTSGTVQQGAFARWMSVEDGTRVLYFAIGMTGYPGDYISTGAIGRAECREISHGGHTAWSCRGRADAVELAPGDFVVDPLLASASLKITDEEGTINTVSWTGKGTQPTPYVHQHAGNDVGVQVMTMLGRSASITGNVAGIDVAAGRGAALAEGYDVNVYLDGLRSPAGRFVFRDGAIFYRTVLRTSR